MHTIPATDSYYHSFQDLFLILYRLLSEDREENSCLANNLKEFFDFFSSPEALLGTPFHISFGAANHPPDH
jgi:hypothetical protein